MKKIKNIINFIYSRLGNKIKRNVFLIIIVSLIANILAIILPLFQKNIIDAIVKSNLENGLIFIFLISGLTISLIYIIESLLLEKLFRNLKGRVQYELLTSITRQNNKIIDQRGPGAYMTGLFGNSEQISMLLKKNYFSMIIGIIVSLFALIISAKWTLTFPLLIVGSYILIFSIIKITNKIHISNFNKARELVFETNPKVLEFIENKRSISGYGNILKLENRIYKLFEERDNYFKKASYASIFGNSSIVAIKNIVLTIFFILSMFQIQKGNLELSAFIAILSYFPIVFKPIDSIQEIYSNINKFEMFYKRIEDNLLKKPKLDLPENNKIKISNCSFSYSNTEIIENLNLEINKKIGLVGLSGEGKSTILKMIFGEISPLRGYVEFGNKDVRNIHKPFVYSSIRYYSQEMEIFDEDLNFNVTLGKIGLSKNEYMEKLKNYEAQLFKLIKKIKTMKEPLNLKNLDYEYINMIYEIFNINDCYVEKENLLYEIIEKIKDNKINVSFVAEILFSRDYYILEKYENIIKELELEKLGNRKLGQRGKKISGGEKNRVCMARFLLPEHNGPFIIDEPFTSLDAISEEKNLKILKEYIKNKNGIIISHKINIIKELADEIIVIDKGKIIEKGTHDELIQNQKLYSKIHKNFVKMKNV
ncbi:hypothetical protein LN42_03400 [Marinitoga sp. 1137]|uniref:ATP-binding cassette domain-containing protein n=1 Tax=Marinitoga sp. 1137 TaxID=1545835 RepID=UPI000950A6B2|nr:ABC transporter ATP-binding protein [Marinitoga sp. 1137]APT75543.1 hypothetical protein LN42_03400 [Marinitoga sp. 1137]